MEGAARSAAQGAWRHRCWKSGRASTRRHCHGQRQGLGGDESELRARPPVGGSRSILKDQGQTGRVVQARPHDVVQSPLHHDRCRDGSLSGGEYNFTGPDLRRRVVDSVLDETRGVPRRLDMPPVVRDMWVIRPQLPMVGRSGSASREAATRRSRCPIPGMSWPLDDRRDLCLSVRPPIRLCRE